MLVRKLFKHLRAGRIAARGLFRRANAELFKQQLAQLLRGIQVDLNARHRADFIRQLANALSEHFAERLQRVRIHEEARALHIPRARSTAAARSRE